MPQPVTEPGDDEEQAPEDDSSEAQACGISIAAVVRGHDGLRVLVQDGTSGDALWASVGDTVFGYEVELITSRGALVRKDDRNYVLQLGAKASKATDDDEKEPETEEDSSEDDTAEEETKSAEGDARFYGTWTATMSEGGMSVEISITFRDDDTGSVSAMGQGQDFTWSVNGDSLSMGELGGSSEDIPFRFEEGGDVLVIEEGPMGGEVRLEKE